jgi:hypothetical protein
LAGSIDKASAERGMIWPRKGILRISNTNIFTGSIPQFTTTVGPIGTKVLIYGSRWFAFSAQLRDCPAIKSCQGWFSADPH